MQVSGDHVHAGPECIVEGGVLSSFVAMFHNCVVIYEHCPSLFPPRREMVSKAESFDFEMGRAHV